MSSSTVSTTGPRGSTHCATAPARPSTGRCASHPWPFPNACRATIPAISSSPAGTSGDYASDHPGATKGGDLLHAITVLGEPRAGGPAHLVRRVLDRRSAMRKLERGERHPYRAVDAGDPVEFMEHAALGGMRVGGGFGHCADLVGRHVARLEIDLPLVGGLGFDNVRNDCGFPLAVIDPRLVVGLDHVGSVDRGAKPRLLADVASGGHHHALLGVVGAVGGEGLLVAVRFRLAAVAEIAGHQRGLHHHRDAEHREVDVLALAGALALEEGLASAKAPIVPVA